ncbi:MAG: hypothetical protein MZV70_52065 [Desulfobacterales bacterium]|nr:hypothetical protein [Desulfobacterales bacterium]
MDTLKVRAADEGTWGDRLSVQVEDGSLDPSGAFNLVVRHKGEVVEVFRDLSMDEAAPNHVEIVVNERSDFITVEDLGTASGLPLDRPVIGVFDLSGGDDGLDGVGRRRLLRRSLPAHRLLRLRRDRRAEPDHGSGRHDRRGDPRRRSPTRKTARTSCFSPKRPFTSSPWRRWISARARGCIPTGRSTRPMPRSTIPGSRSTTR